MHWLFDLTEHQLDVLRTLAAIAGGIGGFLSGIAVVYARLAAKRSNITVQNTSTTEWKEGMIRNRSVAETGEQILHGTEALRGELTHLAAEQARAHGRRRMPTTDIPLPRRSQRNPTSLYTAAMDVPEEENTE